MTLAFNKHTLGRRPCTCNDVETCSFKKVSFILMATKMRIKIVTFSFICLHDNSRGLWGERNEMEKSSREKDEQG